MQHMGCEIVIIFFNKAKKKNQRLQNLCLGKYAKIRHDCEQHALSLKLDPIYDLSRPVDQMSTRDPFPPHLFCVNTIQH